jgi:hypothetical protein
MAHIKGERRVNKFSQVSAYVIMHGFKLLINEKNNENERSMRILYTW